MGRQFDEKILYCHGREVSGGGGGGDGDGMGYGVEMF